MAFMQTNTSMAATLAPMISRDIRSTVGAIMLSIKCRPDAVRRHDIFDGLDNVCYTRHFSEDVLILLQRRPSKQLILSSATNLRHISASDSFFSC